MDQLDATDHKILYHLFLNSRQSTNSICKKIGISKQAFDNRVSKLEEQHIIRGYPAVINPFKLGYSIYRFNIQLQYASPEIEEEIAQHFITYDYTWNVSSTKGDYDLVIAILVRDFHSFYLFYEETLKKYRYYFKELTFTQLCETYGYRHSILLDDRQSYDEKVYELRNTGETVPLDDIDYKILFHLSQNSRIPTIELSQQLDISSATVINHLKKLISFDVILKYSIDIDVEQLGYKTFIVNINLTTYDHKNQIIKYLSNNPFIWEIRRSIGSYDIELIIYTLNFEHFHKILEDLKRHFSDDINSYRYLHVTAPYKINCLPSELQKMDVSKEE